MEINFSSKVYSKSLLKYREIHYNKGSHKNGRQQIESSAESNIFKKNQKCEKNEECTVTVKTATDQ